jgi:GNAT superfamily N-acetyltransferase
VIRSSRLEDSERIQQVDLSAGSRFAEVGLQRISEHPPVALENLEEFARSGRSWVAVDDSGTIVGYVVVEVVDDYAHVEQLSVERSRHGEGFGKALLAEVESWADREGFDAMTLTTFSDVPFNRPLYEHLGWVVLPESELSPGLLAIRDAERERGIEPPPRVCMRKKISRTRSG